MREGIINGPDGQDLLERVIDGKVSIGREGKNFFVMADFGQCEFSSLKDAGSNSGNDNCPKIKTPQVSSFH